MHASDFGSMRRRRTLDIMAVDGRHVVGGEPTMAFLDEDVLTAGAHRRR